MLKGMGGHESPRAISEDWITPPEIIAALGPFYLDPCACLMQPWPTATHKYTILDNGLLKPWYGRVWLNPPYGRETARWMARLAEHGDGIALIFARTETEMFFRYVWDRADAVLFLRGRVYFCRPDGIPGRHNSGAPSVLIAYGRKNVSALKKCGIAGQFIALKHGHEGAE